MLDLEDRRREKSGKNVFKQILDRPLALGNDLGFTNPTLHMTEFSAQVMEIEPDIENMTLNEYLEYKGEMERRLQGMFDPKEIQLRGY
ncbi:hypothetical protein Tco_1364856 [Tanacetum coccineum]|uniref:Uncharacterized protein n=1 Tax=Tanacetum coccineum TaxID=301880 RepID=A0ABQ5ICR8_9ASTR